MERIVFRIRVTGCRRSYTLTSMRVVTKPFQLYDTVELTIEGELLEPDDVKGRACTALLKGERKTLEGFRANLRDPVGVKNLGGMTEKNGEISFTCSLPIDAALEVLAAVAPDGLNEIFLGGQEFKDGSVALDILIASNFSNAAPAEVGL